MSPIQRARKNRAPRSKLIEVRGILLNMAEMLDEVERNNYSDGSESSVIFPEHQILGMRDGFRDMAKSLADVLEGM